MVKVRVDESTGQGLAVAMCIIPINCVDGGIFAVVVKTDCGRLILGGLPMCTGMVSSHFAFSICLEMLEMRWEC